ncbi:probable cyclin-dependent serine/threonine-protein kinase DDB_G0292550 [Condylostylus longicornis]|uniref:probable cyclin-dependent serine/threonine-protein kinase DDB_G0292550 n=1 Tax=Condylostylus longicornis TaxID=2530218 RepID=UPI00244DB5B7|nr:probable cyclin-dependent serine/threonine-protein kinase DDB_G0292550 [Condylostylus longicornis]
MPVQDIASGAFRSFRDKISHNSLNTNKNMYQDPNIHHFKLQTSSSATTMPSILEGFQNSRLQPYRSSLYGTKSTKSSAIGVRNNKFTRNIENKQYCHPNGKQQSPSHLKLNYEPQQIKPLTPKLCRRIESTVENIRNIPGKKLETSPYRQHLQQYSSETNSCTNNNGIVATSPAAVCVNKHYVKSQANTNTQQTNLNGIYKSNSRGSIKETNLKKIIDRNSSTRKSFSNNRISIGPPKSPAINTNTTPHVNLTQFQQKYVTGGNGISQKRAYKNTKLSKENHVPNASGLNAKSMTTKQLLSKLSVNNLNGNSHLSNTQQSSQRFSFINGSLRSSVIYKNNHSDKDSNKPASGSWNNNGILSSRGNSLRGSIRKKYYDDDKISSCSTSSLQNGISITKSSAANYNKNLGSPTSPHYEKRRTLLNSSSLNNGVSSLISSTNKNSSISIDCNKTPKTFSSKFPNGLPFEDEFYKNRRSLSQTSSSNYSYYGGCSSSRVEGNKCAINGTADFENHFGHNLHHGDSDENDDDDDNLINEDDEFTRKPSNEPLYVDFTISSDNGNSIYDNSEYYCNYINCNKSLGLKEDHSAKTTGSNDKYNKNDNKNNAAKNSRNNKKDSCNGKSGDVDYFDNIESFTKGYYNMETTTQDEKHNHYITVASWIPKCNRVGLFNTYSNKVNANKKDTNNYNKKDSYESRNILVSTRINNDYEPTTRRKRERTKRSPHYNKSPTSSRRGHKHRYRHDESHEDSSSRRRHRHRSKERGVDNRIASPAKMWMLVVLYSFKRHIAMNGLNETYC